MARQRPIAGERGRSRRGVDLPAGPAGPIDPIDPADPADAADPADPAESRESGPRRGGRRRADAALLLAVALLVALALTAGVLMLRDRGDDRVEQARTQARAAAESHAVTLLSYDHRRLDRDFAEAEKILTGGFADDYASTTEEVVRPTALEVKAVVTAEVASSSVVRASENRAVVLLFVDQTTTSTRLEGPRVDLNRVRMTLDRSDGQWLVSGVDAL